MSNLKEIKTPSEDVAAHVIRLLEEFLEYAKDHPCAALSICMKPKGEDYRFNSVALKRFELVGALEAQKADVLERFT